MTIRVEGTEAAFVGRSLTIEGRALPPPHETIPGQYATSIALCTEDRQTFLSKSFVITVVEGERVTEHTIDRIGCKLATNPGDYDLTVVVLEDDGTISADFGNDVRTKSKCGEGFNDLACYEDERL